MGGFQKTTCSSGAAQFLIHAHGYCQMLRIRSPGRDDAILSTWQL
jgi:hypothetical protein